MSNHLLCIGMGYSARALARRLSANGWRISGSSTSNAGSARVQSLVWEAVRFDGTSSADEAMSKAIGDATHLVVSAAPGEAGDPVLHCLRGTLHQAVKILLAGR